MAIGMTLIGASIIWATRVPVHGHFLANLAGPFVLGGAGTAFSFIPISVAALEGVTERQSGLASGLLNTSTQFGAAIGTAIASSVAASGTKALLRGGDALPDGADRRLPPDVLGARGDRADRPAGGLRRSCADSGRSQAPANSESREPRHALASYQLTHTAE